MSNPRHVQSNVIFPLQVGESVLRFFRNFRGKMEYRGRGVQLVKIPGRDIVQLHVPCTSQRKDIDGIPATSCLNRASSFTPENRTILLNNEESEIVCLFLWTELDSIFESKNARGFYFKLKSELCWNFEEIYNEYLFANVWKISSFFLYRN